MMPIDVHNIYNQTIILLYAYLNGKIQKLYEVGDWSFQNVKYVTKFVIGYFKT